MNDKAEKCAEALAVRLAAQRALNDALTIIVEGGTPHRVDPANLVFARASIVRATNKITEALTILTP